MGLRNWIFSKIRDDNKKIKQEIVDLNIKVEQVNVQFNSFVDFIHHIHHVSKNENEEIRNLVNNMQEAMTILLSKNARLDKGISDLRTMLDLTNSKSQLIDHIFESTANLLKKNENLDKDICDLRTMLDLTNNKFQLIDNILESSTILLEQNFSLEKKISDLSPILDLTSKNTKLIDDINSSVIKLTENSTLFKDSIHNLEQTVNLVSTNRIIGEYQKITCLFLVHNIESWDSIFSVYKKMLYNNQFKVIVASIHRCYPGSKIYKDEEYIHNILSKLNVPHLRLNNSDSYADLDIIKSLSPNIIFRQSQWDNDIPPAFSTNNLRFAKLCLIPYEIMNFVQLGFNHLSSYYHTSCWKLFVANQQTKIEQEQHDKLNGFNVFVTGHPKVKALKNAKPAWPIISNSEEKKFRVLWASHHSIDKHWSNFSVFLNIYNDMLDWAKEDNSIEFVFSPHPALVTVLEAITDEELKHSIDDFFIEWNKLDNTYFYREGPYGPLFQASDILIMDGISWLLEYQLMKKPLIFIEREDHSPFTINGELIATGTNRVSTFQQARNLAYRFKHGELDPNRKNQEIVIDNLLSIDNAEDNVIHSILYDIKF